MEKILLCFIALFFVIGAIDYIEGNKFNVGNIFEDGIKTMGSISLSMIGILSLIPFIIDKIGIIIKLISQKILIDSSILFGSIFAVDMGGYNLCIKMADSNKMGIFSGIILASMLGCTISFTIPIAIGIVNKEENTSLFKGFICGIISMPIGLIIAGLMLKISLVEIIYNLLPVILIVILIILGIIFKLRRTITVFKYFAKIIKYINVIGLIVQGVYSICGIKLIDKIMPVNEVFMIVGRIALFLSGAYVMIEILKRLLKNYLTYIEKITHINSHSIFALLSSLASAIIIFENFNKLDYKGKIICTAFSVSGAYVLGGQLGYISSVEPEYIGLYIFIKLITGVIAVFVAIIFLKYENKI